MNGKNHVKTAIRWRPCSENENVIIKKGNANAIYFGSQPKIFCFDHVFDTSDQNEVYNILVKPLVDKALKGYNCTFLASGQTGSGKTYTMGFESSVNSENNGMAPRVLDSIFSYEDAKRVEVAISFVEVYNDQAFDLLGQNPHEPFSKKDSGMSEANKKSVQNNSEVLALLAQGTKNRRVRCTKMNATSSRSHAIFTIKLRIQDTENAIRESVINLVDLAGSECIDKTGNTGKESIYEGKCINESLSAFKRVIIAMSSGASHIPFRDAVITYILRKSLEIGCYLTLLGCVSPFQCDYGETFSTLNFVADAKLIKRTPQLNAVINDIQKLKTPMKMSFQTPNSAFRPPFPFSSIENKLSLPSMPMSEPRKSNSVIAKRFGRKSISSSTEKLMSIPNNQNIRRSYGVNRLKVVNSLFPSTACRKAVGSALVNNESTNFNFSVASTSSDMNIAFREIDSSKKLVESQHTTNTSEVNRIIEHLTDETNKMMDNGFNLNVIDIISVALIKIKDKNPTITGSFHSTPTQAAMLSTVMENECSEANSPVMENECMEANSPVMENECTEANSPVMEIVCSATNMLVKENECGGADSTVLENEYSEPNSNKESNVNDASMKNEPRKEQIFSISSTEERNIDPIPSPNVQSPIVSRNCDHTEKTIIAEVNKSTCNKVTTIDVPTPQIVSPDTTQEASVLNCDLFDGKMGENSGIDFHDDDMLNNKTMENRSPIIKHTENANIRTPIGKLVIRRLAHSNKFEDTQYSVEIVRKVQSSQVMISQMSPSSLEMDNNYEVVETPNRIPLSTSSPIQSKATKTIYQTPTHPRLILRRGNTIQDYRRYFSSEEDLPQTFNKLKRKLPPTKSTRYSKDSAKKSKFQPMETDLSNKILHILNTASEKGLQKLATIGAKKAYQIFNYRNVKGEFESLDGLLKMPFWSKKTHERFMAHNIFV